MMKALLLILLLVGCGGGGTQENRITPPLVTEYVFPETKENRDIVTGVNPGDDSKWYFTGTALSPEWRRIGSGACVREISCNVHMQWLAQRKDKTVVEEVQQPSLTDERVEWIRGVGDISQPHVHSWGAWRSGYILVHGRADRRITVTAHNGPRSSVTFTSEDYLNYARSAPTEDYTWSGKMYGHVERGLPPRGHGIGISSDPERFNVPLSIEVTADDVMDVRADVALTVNGGDLTGQLHVTSMQYRSDGLVEHGPHPNHTLNMTFYHNGTFQGGSRETGGVLGRFIGSAHSAAIGSYGRFGVFGYWAATRPSQ